MGHPGAMNEAVAWRIGWRSVRSADAVAVQALVNCTGTAGFDQPLLQRLARAMDAHCSVGRRNVVAAGKVSQRSLIQIHLLQNPGVVGRERWQHLGYASADEIVGQIVRGDFGLKLLCPLAERAIFDCAVPVEIDYGVAQDAIEPRRRRFAGAQVGFVLERTNISALKNILRDCRRVDAALEKTQEQAPLLDESCKRRLGPRRRFPGASFLRLS